MTTQSETRLLPVLRSMKALHGMQTAHLKKLATLATTVTLAKDHLIYGEGDPGDAIYFIKEGQVVIEMNGPELSHPVTMYQVGPGELFGWSALFPPRRKQARARAVVPSQVIAIDAARLRQAFLADQGLENALIQRVTEVIADRMSLTRHKLASMVTSGLTA